jgi:hypothetical protein
MFWISKRKIRNKIKQLSETIERCETTKAEIKDKHYKSDTESFQKYNSKMVEWTTKINKHKAVRNAFNDLLK